MGVSWKTEVDIQSTLDNHTLVFTMIMKPAYDYADKKQR